MNTLRDLYEARQYQHIIEAVNASDIPSVDQLEWRGEAYYALGNYSAAIVDFQAVLREKSVEVRFGIFQRLRASIRNAGLEKSAAQAFWHSCSDDASLRMGELAQRLDNGDLNGLVEAFEEQVGALVPAGAAAWTRAFDLLVRGLSGDSPPPHTHTCPAEGRRLWHGMERQQRHLRLSA